MIEEEVKLTAGVEFSVVNYEELVDGAQIEEDKNIETLTTYFDTAEFLMTKRKSSLRFRCYVGDLDDTVHLGEDVSGTWTIKDGGESATSDGVVSVKRHEINVKGKFGDSLDELFGRAEVRPIPRETLSPIARMISRRHSTTISLAGEKVAVDDDVADILCIENNQVVHTFREIEVELLSDEGGLTLRNALVSKLIELGARYSDSPSKLHLALSLLYPNEGI